MWRTLLTTLLGRRKGTSDSAVTTPSFFVYRMDRIEGPCDVMSLVPPDAVMVKDGGLPGESVVGVFNQVVTSGVDVDAEHFQPNQAFVELLHQIVATHGLQSPSLRVAARQQQTGWVYVIDGRTPTPAGEVPPHDIIGAFEVQEGMIVSGSYQANPNHRVFSSDGLVTLEPSLQRMLLERLGKGAVSSQDHMGRSS